MSSANASPRTSSADMAAPQSMQVFSERNACSAVEVVGDVRQTVTAEFRRDWRKLAAEAGTPNAFAEPFFVEAALQRLVRPGKVKLVAFADDHGLIGLLPLTVSAPIPGIGRVANRFMHIHDFDGTPLVRRGSEALFRTKLGAWLKHEGIAFLRLRDVEETSPVIDGLLNEEDQTLQAAVVARLVRASLHLGSGGLEAMQSGKKRRGMQRRKRRLQELGELSFVDLSAQPPSAWADDFLTLEASGWKGEMGTAIACRPQERAFFEKMVEAGSASGNLIVHALELDGRRISMTLYLRAGDGAWGFKKAYASDLARCSPGFVLEAESAAALQAQGELAFVDTCSIDAATLVPGLWPQERAMADIVVAVGSARKWLKSAVWLEETYRARRRDLRSLYVRLKRLPAQARRDRPAATHN
ncbi:GNAT family N-acetyltransferase [Afifella marina]|uniref:Acetyltransferase involved in cellulose biosynthesis, CelD/BcsL family n=1 Tax=Afifella marina DSM 2698 TaxID=1120955 RepID=A0A1G5NQU4_AFIMA|nr:GNAT family N-acetyltransferase [Afifella marina]SCZ39767.1 Acetyltransferase involved in cellulose biosynthesis, CelD/BcsL family [Afifella marina DSM 2698]